MSHRLCPEGSPLLPAPTSLATPSALDDPPEPYDFSDQSLQDSGTRTAGFAALLPPGSRDAGGISERGDHERAPQALSATLPQPRPAHRPSPQSQRAPEPQPPPPRGSGRRGRPRKLRLEGEHGHVALSAPHAPAQPPPHALTHASQQRLSAVASADYYDELDPVAPVLPSALPSPAASPHYSGTFESPWPSSATSSYGGTASPATYGDDELELDHEDAALDEATHFLAHYADVPVPQLLAYAQAYAPAPANLAAPTTPRHPHVQTHYAPPGHLTHAAMRSASAYEASEEEYYAPGHAPAASFVQAMHFAHSPASDAHL